MWRNSEEHILWETEWTELSLLITKVWCNFGCFRVFTYMWCNEGVSVMSIQCMPHSPLLEDACYPTDSVTGHLDSENLNESPSHFLVLLITLIVLKTDCRNLIKHLISSLLLWTNTSQNFCQEALLSSTWITLSVFYQSSYDSTLLPSLNCVIHTGSKNWKRTWTFTSWWNERECNGQAHNWIRW